MSMNPFTAPPPPQLESISSAVIASLEPTLPTFENVIGHPVPTFFTYSGDRDPFPHHIMVALMLRH
jgi:ribonuclease BN (tRNA processing enzyme)